MPAIIGEMETPEAFDIEREKLAYRGDLFDAALAAGAAIRVTDRGVVVARVAPLAPGATWSCVRAVIADADAIRQRVGRGDRPVKALIEEGRRF
jgi:antitoxin (DNA-binding transcriptional repressor) of toxin-antitoxin stability system